MQLNSNLSVARYVQSPLSFTLSTTTVVYDHNVTVTWAIPEDEATHKDWIGQLMQHCFLVDDFTADWENRHEVLVYVLSE